MRPFFFLSLFICFYIIMSVLLLCIVVYVYALSYVGKKKKILFVFRLCAETVREIL